jgi:hypothetical protein
MAIYAWVAAAKSIRARIAALGSTTPSAVDTDTAVLVATIYSTVRLTTASHTSAAAMVASNVAWRVASTIGCSEHHINMLIEQCASAYRVAEQDLPAYKAAAIEQRSSR